MLYYVSYYCVLFVSNVSWPAKQFGKTPTSILHSFNRPVETIIYCLQMDTVVLQNTNLHSMRLCLRLISFILLILVHRVHNKHCLKIDFGFVLIIEYIWLLINIYSCVQPGSYMKIGKWGNFKYSMIKLQNCPKLTCMITYLEFH